MDLKFVVTISIAGFEEAIQAEIDKRSTCCGFPKSETSAAPGDPFVEESIFGVSGVPSGQVSGLPTLPPLDPMSRAVNPPVNASFGLAPGIVATPAVQLQ